MVVKLYQDRCKLMLIAVTLVDSVDAVGTVGAFV